MAYVRELQLPRFGEAMDSVRVTHWMVAPGESFGSGDTLLEIETDKSVIEVPASEDGKMVEQLVGIGDLIDTNGPIARIELVGEPPEEEPAATAAPQPAEPPEPPTSASLPTPPGDPASRLAPATLAHAPEAVEAGRKFATPVARMLARENGLDLTVIRGSGPRGRVIKADVDSALARQRHPPHPASGAGDEQGSTEERDIATAHGEIHVKMWIPPVVQCDAAVVLIHGIFGDIETWAATASSASRAGFRVVAIDLPCHGRSRSGVTRFTDIVEACAEAISVASTGPIALVGHSFGGGVAARIARKPDLDIASLTLFSPIGLGTEIEQSFLNGMIHAGSLAALEREMGKLTVAGATPSSAYLRKLRNRLEAQAGALESLSREVSWNGVQQLNIIPDIDAMICPVTVVHGRDDAIVPWRHALNAPPKAALHLIPRVGHMPQWEAVALTGEIIARAARAGEHR